MGGILRLRCSDDFFIINGYYKTQQIWKENSRVKTFLFYYNNIPICYIELQDIRGIQSFSLKQFLCFLQCDENINKNKPIVKEDDILKFEIVKVYPGLKYKDTAITEFVGRMLPP